MKNCSNLKLIAHELFNYRLNIPFLTNFMKKGQRLMVVIIKAFHSSATKRSSSNCKLNFPVSLKFILRATESLALSEL
jgi:hypothetical protein